ncbi:MAG: dTDP-4-dehydrorhamnose 3,5-epimerase [Candidatus Moranbacteria bacterium]|nr:dTDP-4-dehydrorhamnose 3,5-epimerase [Candidatus Moranbacteria bacterium]
METKRFFIDGPVLLQPEVFIDDRGCFFESFSVERYQKLGIPADRFVQDNVSKSKRGVVRGLHYQARPFEQGKLVQVLCGRVLDVAVDIRVGSPTYGRHVMVELSGVNHKQFWIPAGFAHAFMSLVDNTIFTYKVTGLYHKESDRGILWNDPALDIAWPKDVTPIVSSKDAASPPLSEIVDAFVYNEEH